MSDSIHTDARATTRPVAPSGPRTESSHDRELPEVDLLRAEPAWPIPYGYAVSRRRK